MPRVAQVTLSLNPDDSAALDRAQKALAARAGDGWDSESYVLRRAADTRSGTALYFLRAGLTAAETAATSTKASRKPAAGPGKRASSKRGAK